MPQPLLAYILAGGKSSRFGSDKARALLHNEPLILRHAKTLRSLQLPVTAVADIPDKYADLQIPTIPDLTPHLGPLGGLLTALTHAAQSSPSAWIFLTSCDLLTLQPEWITQLQKAITPRSQIVAFHDSVWQPFPALYHTSLLPEVRHRISTHELSCWRLLHSTPATPAPLPPNWHLFLQANTPQDLPPPSTPQ